MSDAAGVLSRYFALAYGLFCYAVGAGALFWFFFASLALLPFGMVALTQSIAGALIVNLLLVLAFGLQHSVMARPGFKRRWIALVPPHLERSTYVLLSGLFLIPIILLWQPLPGQIWLIENQTLALAIRIIAALGFAYLLFASFFTNHFELFGLRQVWLYFRGVPYSKLEFKSNWVYGFSRHPIMTGLLIVFWFTPDMSSTRLALAILLTAYVLLGIKVEESTLVEEFGDGYRNYRKDVGMFFTMRRRPRPPLAPTGSATPH